MIKPHDRIWLQWEEYEGENVTWCKDKINDTDVEYIRIDHYNRILSTYTEIVETIAKIEKKSVEIEENLSFLNCIFGVKK